MPSPKTKRTLYLLMVILVGILTGLLSWNCPGFPRWIAWIVTPGLPLLMWINRPNYRRHKYL